LASAWLTRLLRIVQMTNRQIFGIRIESLCGCRRWDVNVNTRCGRAQQAKQRFELTLKVGLVPPKDPHAAPRAAEQSHTAQRTPAIGPTLRSFLWHEAAWHPDGITCNMLFSVIEGRG
jgi:hypothetical protein